MSAYVSAAAICSEILQDLDSFRTAEDSAELDLEEAATVSGYSADHLRRMVREGRIPHIGGDVSCSSVLEIYRQSLEQLTRLLVMRTIRSPMLGEWLPNVTMEMLAGTQTAA